MSLQTPAAWAVTELVAKQLGVTIDPGLRSQTLKKVAQGPAGPAELRERLFQVGGPFRIAFLDRPAEATELEALSRQRALPFVVLLARPDGQADALVVQERHGDQARLVEIQPDLGPTPREMPIATLAHQVDDRPGSLCLVPVSVAPSVSPDTSAHGVHEHPTPVRRLLQLLVRERREIWLVLFYAALVGLFSLVLPLTVQAVVGLAMSRQLLQPQVLLIVFVVIGTLVAGVLTVTQMRVVEVIQQRIFARLSLEFSFLLPRIQLEAVNGVDLPEQMNRFFEVVNIQKSLAKLLTETVGALLQVTFGMILLTFYHPYFTLFGALLLALLVLVFWWTGPRGLATAINESRYKYRVVHWLEEMARTIGTLKLGGRSNLALERMDEELAGYLKYRKAHFRILVQQAASIVVVKTLITAALLGVGMVLVAQEAITLGQFVASELVIVTVLVGVEKIITSLPTIFDILVAVEKSGHVTDTPLEVAGGLRLPENPKEPGVAVQTRGLSYRYPGADGWAVQDLNLSVDGGALVAITGYEGAGQSTLLKVLGGMLPGYHGALVYNGVSMRDLDPLSFRQQVGGCFAQPDLFEGTLAENITLGRAAIRPADVIEALERVGLAEQVQLLPDGLDTRVSLGGRSLPLTMVRKVMLARAIVGRPKLLLIDDYFEHLEPGYRREVIRMLSDQHADWTVIAATHDPMYLAACDWIFLMDEARVVREGTYAELLDDGRFRGIVSQALDFRTGRGEAA